MAGTRPAMTIEKIDGMKLTKMVRLRRSLANPLTTPLSSWPALCRLSTDFSPFFSAAAPQWKFRPFGITLAEASASCFAASGDFWKKRTMRGCRASPSRES